MSFWTDALWRKSDDGAAQRLHARIFENAPDKDASEYVELTLKVRVKGGNTYAEDTVRIDDVAKLHLVDAYVRHSISRFGTVSVMSSAGSLATLVTIRTGEIVAVEAVTRTVRLNDEDRRRAAGFHPPIIPGPRQPSHDGQQPETD